MNYTEFKSEVVDRIRESEGPGTEVGIHRVPKNNGLVLDGLTILRPGCNISPTIYLEKYYRHYSTGEMPIESVVSDILKEHSSHDICGFIDTKQLTEFGNIGGKIYPRLINYNRNRGFLQQVPHRRFLDLAVIYYFEVSGHGFGEATSILNNREALCWQMDEETIYKTAMANMLRSKPARMLSMDRLLEEIGAPRSLTGDMNPMQLQMTVLTNEDRYFGANCLLVPECFRKLADSAGKDLFLLPSSVHEIIALPDDGSYSRLDLEKMVIEVNTTQVISCEVLSDHVYRYSREARTVLY